MAEPILVPITLEPRTQRSLQVIDTRSGNRLVTALEFLSPTNKSDAAGRTAYEQKQHELRAAAVNLVEIDSGQARDVQMTEQLSRINKARN